MAGHRVLGGVVDYPTEYSPALLEAIDRRSSREALGISGGSLPFRGQDVWNGYDFTWLNGRGVPEVAVVQIRFPCSSGNMIESKSLKLYLGSFSLVRFQHRNELVAVLENDLSKLADGPVSVALMQPEMVVHAGLGGLAGHCLDHLNVEIEEYFWNPDHLETEGDVVVRESLYSHLLRTICPVTGQPDLASIQIQYQGRNISNEGLLRYIVSYRQHAEFCEQVVERIFIDIMNRCQPDRLSIQARYSRRGGLDINPFRSIDEGMGVDVRSWRQ